MEYIIFFVFLSNLNGSDFFHDSVIFFSTSTFQFFIWLNFIICISKATFKILLQKLFIPKGLKDYMADTRINMPTGFGGLMRFNEEYSSAFSLKPTHVIIFVIFIVAFRIFLGF